MVTSEQDHVEAFLAAAAANMCETTRVGSAQAGMAIVEIATRHAAGGLVALATGDLLLDALRVEEGLRAGGYRVLRPQDADWRALLPEAAVGVTGAAVAVAEQGVVALSCGPGSPRGTSLLPAVHVCAVRSADVVATLADAFAMLGREVLPSAVSWIGGPSRTGDLGMTLTLGVHGPRAVEIIVVDT